MEQNRSSESIAKLTEALSKAQGIIEGAKKDADNPFFKTTYADLSSVWRACRGPLSENGLAVMQTVETCNDKYILVTTLSHSSGEWMRSFMPILLVKHDPQSLVSSITYCRRASLAAMVGVCPSDDDGESAMCRDYVEVKPIHIPLSESQCAELDDLLADDGSGEWVITEVTKKKGIKTIYEIDSAYFENDLKKWLLNRKKIKAVKK
jgi:hypothetical protein